MESARSEAVQNDLLLSSIQKSDDKIDADAIIGQIIVKCKGEMENNCLYKPLEDYIERIAHYTGLPKVIISQHISKNHHEIDLHDKHFSLIERMKIFEFMAQLYSHKERPTYKKVFTWYKTINTKRTFSQFHYMISCLGFEYHKIESGQEILIENPTFTFERYLYLKQINNFRYKSAPIYYIDERVFDKTFTFHKPWVKHIDISSQHFDGYVFYHAISKQGFLNGLFCAPTEQKDFTKWISHIVIPQLPVPSIIVMDSNHLHGSAINTITKYHSSDDMLQYLRQKNIPCDNNLHKAELYELINKCSVNHTCYDIDDILRAHGHQVLRLPSTFHDLSLTYFLWKYFVDSQPNLFHNIELPQIKILMLEKLSHLPKQLWDSFHQALIELEKDILIVDRKVYEALKTNFKIS